MTAITELTAEQQQDLRRALRHQQEALDQLQRANRRLLLWLERTAAPQMETIAIDRPVDAR